MSRTKWVSLTDFSETIKTRIHNRADCFIIITGLPGTGKSTLAIQLSKLVDSQFQLQKNMIFDPNPQKIVDKVTLLPHFAAVIFDEAMRALNKRKAMSMLNTFLGEFIALCRKEYKLLVLCTPTIRQLDSSVVNDRAIYWIDIPKRGTAVVFTRKKHSSAEDPFGIKKHLIDRAILSVHPGKSSLELTDNEMLDVYASIRDHYVCTIKFNALSPGEEKEYEETAAAMRKAIKVPEDWGDRAKLTKMRLNKLVGYIYQNYEENQQSMTEVMNCSQGYVSLCLKEEGIKKNK